MARGCQGLITPGRGRGRAPENWKEESGPARCRAAVFLEASSCGALFFLLLLRLQAVEKIGGALRVCGCAENRAFVFLQHLEPVPEIGGVVVPDFRRDAKIGAQESGSQLRNKFLAGVAMITKTLRAEIPFKAGSCSVQWVSSCRAVA